MNRLLYVDLEDAPALPEPDLQRQGLDGRVVVSVRVPILDYRVVWPPRCPPR